MILGYYAGYLETSLDRSFRHVAWGSQYGGNIQSDPIFGCISHFLRRAYDKGIWIQTPFERKTQKIDWANLESNNKLAPFLFVLAGDCGEITLSEIINYVEEGSNLVILNSTDVRLRAIEFGKSEKLEQFYQQFYKLIGVDITDIKQKMIISKGQGNIFLINADNVSDAQIEQGPFEAWSIKKELNGLEQIDDILFQIGTFSIPCVDCQVTNIPSSWPNNESIIIELAFFNRYSSEIKQVNSSLQLGKNIEPLSLIDFEISNLQPMKLAKRNIEFGGDEKFSAQLLEEYNKQAYKASIIVVPREIGTISNPFKVHLSYEGITRSIPLAISKMEIIQSLPKLVRAVQPHNIDFSDSLRKFEKYFESVTSTSTLLELLNIDPASVVQKVRQIGEYIVRAIARQRTQNYDTKSDFASINQILYKEKVISDKAKGYIETIRFIGNLASHPSNNEFNKDDAIIVCQALVLFLNEAISQSLI